MSIGTPSPEEIANMTPEQLRLQLEFLINYLTILQEEVKAAQELADAYHKHLVKTLRENIELKKGEKG